MFIMPELRQMPRESRAITHRAASGEAPVAEPPPRERRTMRLIEPQPLAPRGQHLPVIAQAAAPFGIVEPPFRGDALGADGMGRLVPPPAPAKRRAGPPARLRRDRLGPPEHQRAGMRG